MSHLRFVQLLAFGEVALSSALVDHPVRQDIVDRVNNDNTIGWRAEEVKHNIFANRSVEEIKGMMGLKDYAKTQPVSDGVTVQVGDIPDAFDGRDKFSSCQFAIRNQANCGSCWAFGAAETLSTNLCVLGVSHEVLSPQDLVSCDKTDHACQGGTLPNAWDYMQSNGLSSDSSDPYACATGCDNNTAVPACPASRPYPKKCPVEYSSLNSDQEIQAAVMTVGAVEVGFFVMADFMNYKSGIFHSTSKQTLGGHAVKIVGWGHLGTRFYWIVQNSWGASWGEEGYFRIDNWKEDNESSIAIGGGWACVQGNTPTPPSPGPSPTHCEDIASYCADEAGTHAKCKASPYLIPVCKKTCGCCDIDPPTYC
jgi:hypothetical protein